MVSCAFTAIGRSEIANAALIRLHLICFVLSYGNCYLPFDRIKSFGLALPARGCPEYQCQPARKHEIDRHRRSNEKLGPTVTDAPVTLRDFSSVILLQTNLAASRRNTCFVKGHHGYLKSGQTTRSFDRGRPQAAHTTMTGEPRATASTLGYG